MKKISIFLIQTLYLFSATFSLELQKNTAFVNEPIIATAIFHYKKEDRVKKIELGDIELKNFSVQEIKQITKDGIKKYIFLFIPLQSGEFTIKRLSLKALVEEEKTALKQWKFFYTKMQKITVLEAPLDIVGSLKMQSSLKREKNIINYTLILKGLANFELIKPFKLDINSYYYTTKAQISYEYNNSKVVGIYKQNFSILPNKDITIPPIHFQYFNSNTKMIETLQTKPFRVEIKKEFNYFYLFSFILGALCMLFFILLWRRKKTPPSLIKKIAQAKTEKELYEILIKNAHKYDFAEEIKLLESRLYHNKRVKIKKRDIIKKVKGNVHS